MGSTRSIDSTVNVASIDSVFKGCDSEAPGGLPRMVDILPQQNRTKSNEERRIAIRFRHRDIDDERAVRSRSVRPRGYENRVKLSIVSWNESTDDPALLQWQCMIIRVILQHCEQEMPQLI
jgi:hypothetical protein